MAKLKYALNNGEVIVFKVSCVRHGFWGVYTHVLTVTNQCVILEKYGMLNNFKGIERYYYNDISQAIQGEASNGEKQLELYVGGKAEEFALQSGNENELKVLIMAINDQMGPEAEHYDYNYYQSIFTESRDLDRIMELREKAGDEVSIADVSGIADLVGTAAKNIIKSGDLSVGGVVKGVTKAAGKQKKKSLFGGMIDELLDDFGIYDIQDEFTEIGNEFREEFGLKTKMTHAERKELEELEEKRRKQEIARAKKAAMQDNIDQKKSKIDGKKNPQPVETSKTSMSVQEQMEVLKQMKVLLDAGVLTQEEFDRKKQEILNG